ncbi:MAG: hypothetical protein U9P79_06890 [Candidatus Cloacimonadota bacterium]|nr:hypothetical protein [Candidatus Cloacimonadota bacterium]
MDTYFQVLTECGFDSTNIIQFWDEIETNVKYFVLTEIEYNGELIFTLNDPQLLLERKEEIVNQIIQNSSNSAFVDDINNINGIIQQSTQNLINDLQNNLDPEQIVINWISNIENLESISYNTEDGADMAAKIVGFTLSSYEISTRDWHNIGGIISDGIGGLIGGGLGAMGASVVYEVTYDILNN